MDRRGQEAPSRRAQSRLRRTVGRDARLGTRECDSRVRPDPQLRRGHGWPNRQAQPNAEGSLRRHLLDRPDLQALPDPKPSYVADWDELPQWQQETDADIFE